MAENFSFRSSMNGFNRNDVIAYVERILAEKADLQMQLVNTQKYMEEAKNELKTSAEKWKKEIDESDMEKDAEIARLRNELAERKADIDTLRGVIAQSDEKEKLKDSEISAEKELLRAKEGHYKTEIEQLKLKIKELENENAVALSKQNDKCSECDIAKVYEARLGAAMLDAKRFSEILVKEANDKASGLFADAFSSAHATSVKAGEIAESITDISNQFNVSFKVLLDNMNVLGKALDSFKNDVKVTGEKFDFTTEFAAFSGEKSAVVSDTADKDTEDIIPVRKHNVNFDDADEFDVRVDVND